MINLDFRDELGILNLNSFFFFFEKRIPLNYETYIFFS